MYDGIQELLAPDQLKFPKTAAFAAHCMALQDADGRIPAARFEPAAIPKLAPYLVILGVLDNGADFLIRLVGTRLVTEFLGADPTGSKLSEILEGGEYGLRTRYIAEMAHRTRKPVLNQPGRTRLREKDYMMLETVTFPLFDAGGAVVKMAALYDYRVDKEASDGTIVPG